MPEVITKESFITITAVFANDNCNYRYMLTKVWDKDKPKAVMIGINPSKATHLKNDNTAMNFMNYCIDNQFGSMSIVNLFSYMDTDSEGLENADQNLEKINDDYIKIACYEADLILVAWGHQRDKYKERKLQVENILIHYCNNVKCFIDKKGNKPKHLRIISKSWECVNYFY